ALGLNHDVPPVRKRSTGPQWLSGPGSPMFLRHGEQSQSGIGVSPLSPSVRITVLDECSGRTFLIGRLLRRTATLRNVGRLQRARLVREAAAPTAGWNRAPASLQL